jgi:hypothetical protein
VLKIKSSKLFLKLKRDIKKYQSKVSSNEGLLNKENNSPMNIISNIIWKILMRLWDQNLKEMMMKLMGRS